jgi:hypothetical protein
LWQGEWGCGESLYGEGVGKASMVKVWEKAGLGWFLTMFWIIHVPTFPITLQIVFVDENSGLNFCFDCLLFSTTFPQNFRLKIHLKLHRRKLQQF